MRPNSQCMTRIYHVLGENGVPLGIVADPRSQPDFRVGAPTVFLRRSAPTNWTVFGSNTTLNDARTPPNRPPEHPPSLGGGSARGSRACSVCSVR